MSCRAVRTYGPGIKQLISQSWREQCNAVATDPKVLGSNPNPSNSLLDQKI